MFIDINEIAPEGLTFEGAVEPRISPAADREGLRVVRASIRGSATPGRKGTNLVARLDARVELQCSRCVEPFETDLEIAVRLTIVGASVEFGDDDMRLDDDDASFFPASEGKIDLAAVALEQIYLDVPLKPVCSPQCRGLCPTCGANRNEIQCGCRRDETDPRLAPLAEIRKGFRGQGSD